MRIHVAAAVALVRPIAKHHRLTCCCRRPPASTVHSPCYALQFSPLQTPLVVLAIDRHMCSIVTANIKYHPPRPHPMRACNRAMHPLGAPARSST